MDIGGFEGYYTVSPCGKVRNARGLILKPYINNSGYACLHLHKEKVRSHHLVHRLVASAYVLNPNRLPEVNHKDGDKLNNSASNLEWVSRVGNIRHAIQSGLTQYNRPTLGKLMSTKSTYHRVGWDKSRGKWLASIFYEGRTRDQRRFTCEHEAARYADSLLDKYGVTDRPRNF